MKSVFLMIFFFITISFVPNGCAQSLNVDSLKVLLNNEKNDSLKVIRFTDVSWEYLYLNMDSALVYANGGIELSNKINNILCQSKAVSQRGNVHYYSGHLDLAIEDYIAGLKFDEVLQDTNLIASDLLAIGNIYLSLDKNYKALEYYREALEMNEILRDTSSIAVLLGNMGAVYIEQEKYDEGLKVLLQSLSYYKKEKDKGEVYQNIGVLYMKKENYLESSNYSKLALAIYEADGGDIRIAGICSNIATTLFKTFKLDEALSFAERSLELAKKVDSKEFKRRAFGNLSRIHAALSDFEKAYNYGVLFIDMRDSIFNENSDKAIAEMETKYQTEKKEKENEILSQKNAIQNLANENQKNEIAKQNTIIIAGVGGLLFLLGLAFVLVRSVRIKKAANIQINKQKDEIEEQRDEITEINGELMASIEYAKNLQDAIIPKAAEISKGIANHFVFWLPRDIVSGDFYWYHKDGNDVYIAAADCTGHGVPGAFVSMACHNVLNQVVIDRHYSDPGVILQQVNNGIQKVFKKEGAIAQAHDGMDIAFTKIDTANNKVIFAGALNPLLVVRGEEIIELKPDRKPIGGSAEVDSLYTEHVLELEKGDWLYMSSDGYQDQFGGVKGKKYKGKNFRKLLQEIATKSPELQKEKLDAEFTRWKGDFEQIDDVLIVGFNLD